MTTKSPIVILHGWGLSAARFEPLISLLKKHGYPVCAPDFPGFGESEMPSRPLFLSDYAEFLDQYLRRHKLNNPILIGHSFGGRVSLKYQLLYPKSVRALILTGAPGFTPIARKKIVIFITIAKLGKFFLSFPGLRFAQDAVRRWYYYFVGARDFYRANGVMRETFKHIVQEDLLSSMKHVSVPCLLCWGELDQIIPVRIAERMQRVIPGAELVVVPGLDHGLPFKNPQEFYEHIQKFLKTL